MEKMKQRNLFSGAIEHCSVEKDPLRSGLEAMEDNLFKAYKKKSCHLVDHIREIGLPEKGQQFRIVTRRTFNAIQFLEYIVERDQVINLKIAIYSINFYAAKILLDLINKNKIISADILMSNLRNKAHREKEEIIKNLLASNEKITLFFCSSHAKTMACETKSGQFYTIEGSGNLAYNSRVEQYVIDNDEDIYRFMDQWMVEIKNFLAGKKEIEVCR